MVELLLGAGSEPNEKAEAFPYFEFVLTEAPIEASPGGSAQALEDVEAQVEAALAKARGVAAAGTPAAPDDDEPSPRPPAGAQRNTSHLAALQTSGEDLLDLSSLVVGIQSDKPALPGAPPGGPGAPPGPPP